MQERIAELLARQLAGEANDAEREELQRLLRNSPEDQYLADILHSYWQTPAGIAGEEVVSDQHFAQILHKAQETEQPSVRPVRRSPARTFLRWTAAAVVTGLLAWTVWPSTRNESIAAPRQNEVVAKKGTRSSLVLPDGSKIWLNADSRLIYNDHFMSDSIREVTLEGEAFFEVARNPKRPFIVHTSGIDVRVLGTAFNVKSYPREKSIETTLIHGSVEVSGRNMSQAPRFILRPHQKLVFNKELHAFEQTDQPAADVLQRTTQAISITSLPPEVADSAIKETSWVYNRLDCEGDTFAELAARMERWFNVRITIKDKEVAAARLQGTFEDESLEEVLQALQYITPFRYSINDNEVVIVKK